MFDELQNIGLKTLFAEQSILALVDMQNKVLSNKKPMIIEANPPVTKKRKRPNGHRW